MWKNGAQTVAQVKKKQKNIREVLGQYSISNHRHSDGIRFPFPNLNLT